MRTLALFGAAGSMVLSSLAAAPATAAPDVPPAEERGTLTAARRAAAEGIDFTTCPAAEQLPPSVLCGTVRVPLDYADPDGTRIALTVSRIKASGPAGSRQGALVYNPGGPGASSTSFPTAAQLPAWKRIAAAYDLVGYAPRGVGRSAPVSCQDPADRAKGPTLAPTEPSEVFKQERIARAKTYALGCAQRTGAALRHYHSLNNARDLEVLRAALGEPKLTYMGASYGTYFGALYATLFPQRVRRMVFDAPVHPAPRQIWYVNNLDQSLAFERRWADFRTWVAKHDKVYGLGSTAEEVRQSYEKVRVGLAARPAGGKVGPGQLHAAMLQAGYHDGYWALRATALSRYLKGDPKPLIEQAAPASASAPASEPSVPEPSVPDGEDPGNGTAVYTAVECNDAPWPEDFAVWDRDNTRLAKLAPFETWDNVWTNLPCAYWKAPRQKPLDVRTGPGVLPPVLILAAERDAATPYEGALELQRRLSGSALVTERDAGTHGIGGGANACVNGHLEKYLLTGAVPGRTPVRRASCAPHPEPDPVSLERRSGLPPAV
ncbi:alpha/beta fold hydrolase [Streptomyces sp. ISL-36]|uniref:alpha/beta hydrolase n=1 Tax=Streptomyces sp. ISL-36 TaxID=2819182 RepID=UPI001BE5C867|nr:alpha/beta fold hydrolase [Streptomyces sp. ISL-36]MBT2440007.1 alpha/beta fold hydrolase [Streptomyces sp. ISL-36]